MTLRTLLLLAGLVFFVGLCGGLLNALRAGQHKGIGPAKVALSNAGGGGTGQEPEAGWQPGLLLNTLTGGIAAVLSWGLYGPLAELNVLTIGADTTESYVTTLSGLVGAFFVGYSGSRWLSAESDKSVLKTSSSAVGDSAATAASGAATAASGAATVASNAADLVEAAAAQDPQLIARANQLRDTAEQVSNQAQQLQGQSEQLKVQAQTINVGQTPLNVLSTARAITKSADEIATIGEQQMP
jgi:hypothetical protein